MRKTSFNSGWQFWEKEEKPIPVQLPHDAMIHSDRRPDSPAGTAQGFFTGGEYIYEKVFHVTDEQAQGHSALQFEGVYKNAKVFLNGAPAGGTAYGYTPFFVSGDGLLKAGGNTIRVECENLRQPDSRWYTGAGIYRPVWMWEGGADYILPEGIKVKTLSYAPAEISVAVQRQCGGVHEIQIEILDGDVTIAAAATQDESVQLSIPAAKLWDEDHPNLYRCRAVLLRNGAVADTAETRFGIRRIEWSPKGLFINGRETLLRGGCVHHDSGILGAATYDESEYRRVARLKAAGYNAIRSSHNPASRAMLDA